MLTFKNKKKYAIIHGLVITFIWVLMFAIPLLFGNFPNDHDWGEVYEIWKGYGYLFLLFLFNHFVLMPYLFFKQHRWAYFSLTTLMVLVFFSVIYSTFKNQLPDLPDGAMGMEQRHVPPGQLGQRDFNSRPQHPDLVAEKPMPMEDFEAERKIRDERDEAHRGERDERGVHPAQFPVLPPNVNGGKPEPGIPPYANLLILAILLLAFDTALSISMKWVENEQKRIELEKENTKNKLIFLRQQVPAPDT